MPMRLQCNRCIIWSELHHRSYQWYCLISNLMFWFSEPRIIPWLTFQSLGYPAWHFSSNLIICSDSNYTSAWNILLHISLLILSFVPILRAWNTWLDISDVTRHYYIYDVIEYTAWHFKRNKHYYIYDVIEYLAWHFRRYNTLLYLWRHIIHCLTFQTLQNIIISMTS